MTIRYLPPVTAFVGMIRLLTARVRLKRDRVGEEIVMEDGERQVIFREMGVDPAEVEMPESTVTLKLRFRFARFSNRLNRWLSLIPIPVIAGMPGFLSKTWTFCYQTGYNQGIYLFESATLAEAYLQSPVITILKKRTVQGTFQWQLKPNDWSGEGRGSKP